MIKLIFVVFYLAILGQYSNSSGSSELILKASTDLFLIVKKFDFLPRIITVGAKSTPSYSSDPLLENLKIIKRKSSRQATYIFWKRTKFGNLLFRSHNVKHIIRPQCLKPIGTHNPDQYPP